MRNSLRIFRESLGRMGADFTSFTTVVLLDGLGRRWSEKDLYLRVATGRGRRVKKNI